MRATLRRAAGPTLAAALGLLSSLPFLLPESPRTRDSLSHLFRVSAFSEALAAGDALPRWLPDYLFGFGYPLFTFYAPLEYYLASALQLLTRDPVLALGWSIALANAFGAVGMWLLARRVFGGKGGVLAAAAFCAAPYLQTNLVVRGAFPEALGMALLPWSLWACTLGGAAGVIAVALSTAGLMLAHSASAVLGLPLAGAFAVAQILGQSGKRRRVAVGFLGFPLGIALSGFWSVGAAAGFGAIAIAGSTAGPEFVAALARPAELVQWSILHQYREAEGEFLAAGAVQALAAVAGAVACLALRRGRFFLGASAGFAVLMLQASAPVWEALPLASSMAFPWRLQGPLAVCFAVAIAGLAAGRWGRIVGVAAGAALAIAGLWNVQPLRLDIAGEDLWALPFGRWESYGGFAGTTSPIQFLPRDAQGAFDRNGPTGRPRPLLDPPSIRSATFTSGRFRVEAETGADSLLQLPQLASPGWSATVDGAPAATRAVGDQGLLAVGIPRGRHLVEAWHDGGDPGRAGAALSAVALVLILGLAGAAFRSHPWPLALGAAACALFAAPAVLGVAAPRAQPGWQAVQGGELLAWRQLPAPDGFLRIEALWQRSASSGRLAALEARDATGRIIASEREPFWFGVIDGDRLAAGALVRSAHAIPVAPDARAGAGRIFLGVADAAGSPRLAEVGEIRIAPPGQAPATPPTVRAVRRLPLGVVLEDLDAGYPDWIAVDAPFVRERAAGKGSVQLGAVLTDGSRNFGQADSFAPLDLVDPDLWPLGSARRVRFLIKPGAAPPGRYDVRIAPRRLLPAGFGDIIGSFRQQAPEPSEPLSAQFGPLRLIGFERLDSCVSLSPSCPARVRLTWLATADGAEDFSVSLQAMNSAGRLAGQADGPPGGSDITSLWRRGDRIWDHRELRLEPAARGEIAIFVAVYRSGRPADRVLVDGKPAVELFRARAG